MLQAACDFKLIEAIPISERSVSVRTGSHEIELGSSRPVQVDASGVHAHLELREGDEWWCVLACGHRAAEWDEKKAAAALAEAERYWRRWAEKVNYEGPRRKQVRRSAILVHQMSYAPAGSHVAAPTTSLPERIGGNWNCDYRLSWIRDTSLSLGILTQLGHTEGAREYLDWLQTLASPEHEPFQVVYGIHGEKDLPQTELKDVQGYRNSKPVRLGNRAYQQDQHGSMGYLVDCIHDYLEGGGEWRPEYWRMVRRVTDYIGSHWKDTTNNSIWELPQAQQCLSGKVLGWCALDRAIKIAQRIGETDRIDAWRSQKEAPAGRHSPARLVRANGRLSPAL